MTSDILGATQVYFNEATGGRYVPRAVLMDLEPGPFVRLPGKLRLVSAVARRARNHGLRASRTLWSALPSRQLRVWTDRTAHSSMYFMTLCDLTKCTCPAARSRQQLGQGSDARKLELRARADLDRFGVASVSD